MNLLKSKLFYILSFSLILFLFATSNFNPLNNNNLSASPEQVILEAKTDYYESLDDMENVAPIILMGTKVSEEEPFIAYGPRKLPSHGYTKSGIKIDKIFKNKSNLKIKKEDIITVVENEITDPKTGTTYHIAGYTKMKQNQSYLLFVYYSEGDQWYVPMGVTFGKIPLDSEELLLVKEQAEKDQLTLPEKIIKQAQKKYNSYMKK